MVMEFWIQITQRTFDLENRFECFCKAEACSCFALWKVIRVELTCYKVKAICINNLKSDAMCGFA